jgi:hypothetical protein
MTARLPLNPLHGALALALAASIGLAGCGKKDAEPAKSTTAPTEATKSSPPAAPTDREIKITTLLPEGDTLKTGDTVQLKLSATYVLPAQGGSVGIVVQDSKNALIANKLTPVAGGSGTVNEEVEFKVPATDRITVHVPLYLKDETKSATVATREYAVKAK